MKKYQITKTTEEHISGYNAALDSVAREGKYLARSEGPSLELSRTYVLNNISKNYPQYVALSDNKIIGWCDIVSRNASPLYSHVGYLGMGVILDYRGQGIGETLIRAALEAAKSRNFTRIELKVGELNKAALDLYLKVGFIKEGLHLNGVHTKNGYENLISMGLLFSSELDE